MYVHEGWRKDENERKKKRTNVKTKKVAAPIFVVWTWIRKRVNDVGLTLFIGKKSKSSEFNIHIRYELCLYFDVFQLVHFDIKFISKYFGMDADVVHDSH